MAYGSVQVKLRPIRLAFLVNPSDKAGILEAIQTSTFLWGGSLNPIIPIFRRLPKTWEHLGKPKTNANSVLGGYLDAFDPDVVVEVGNLELSGLALGNRPRIKCSEILATLDENGVPKYGIGIFELLQYFYDKELRFVRHHPIDLQWSDLSTRNKLFLASVFGAFSQKVAAQLREDWFTRIPNVVTRNCAIDNYFKYLSPGALFMRRLGMIEIQVSNRPSFRRNDCLFFMDANSNLDILDYWNLRAVGWTVMPIAKQEANNPDLQTETVKFVEENYWPFRDNPKLFNRTILLKSRSTSISEVEAFGRSLKLAPIEHPHEFKIVYNPWYPRIWDEWARERDGVGLPVVQMKQEDLNITGEETSAWLKSIVPDFAAEFSGVESPRCANEIEVKSWAQEFLAAEVIPEGDEKIARAAGAMLAHNCRCSKSGLVFYPHYKGELQTLRLAKGEDVFAEWLSARGWNVSVSDKGRVAYQMLKQLGGAFWIDLLADVEIIKLLQKMGDRRSLNAKALASEVAKIASKSKDKFGSAPALMQRLVGAKVGARMVQAGFDIKCPTCRQRSWYSVKEADYRLSCPICFEAFPLPTDNLKEIAWAYRTIGPFALPSQAYGIYSVLLTLRFFKKQLRGPITPILSFTAKKDGTPLEVDLGLLFQESRWNLSSTHLVFAECKTFNLFDKDDVERMHLLATEFPGAVLVFATLNANLTKMEKKVLQPLVNQGRRYWKAERPRNPVLILTGNELFGYYNPRTTWSKMGGIFAKHSHYNGVGGELFNLADATQQIYLGMSPWHQAVAANKRNRRTSKTGQTAESEIALGGTTNNPIAASFPVAMPQVPWTSR